MNVALGTGGAIECGNLDMFEVMRVAAMSARKESGNPAALAVSRRPDDGDCFRRAGAETR